MVAAAYGNVAAAEVLVKAGAKIDAKGKEGKTALELAREEGNTLVVKLLAGQTVK